MAIKQSWFLVVLLSIAILLSACGSQATAIQTKPTQPARNNTLPQQTETPTLTPTPTPIEMILAKQVASPTPTHTPAPTPTPKPQPPTQGYVPPTTNPPTNIPASGTGAAPYGPAPAMSSEEVQLTQQLFTLINSDRAARGLYPYTWNATLAGGARLHSWNMFHCGFSHTCPDGLDQCQRISNEGFAGYTDCGECIAEAGPYPTPYGGMHNIQESMINEPPTGWHRIHLLSTTLHRGGVGVFVDPSGSIWFTEDFVS